MKSDIREQIQEISEKIDKFEIGNKVNFYANQPFVLKNGNVSLYFDEKTLEINRLGVSIGTTEHYIQLRKNEKNFLTKTFKKKLSIFSIERVEKRIKKEQLYLDQIKFNDNENENYI